MRDLPGKRVVLRPPSETDASVLRTIRSTPEVTAWWGLLGDDFPLSDDPGATRFTIICGEEIAGLIQDGEELETDYRYDIFVDPPCQRRGVGTDAIATLVRYLIEERGHHRITIDPAADNGAAVRCYRKAGFRRVGVMEAAWRDSATGRWRDALLMELVVRPRERRRGELTPTNNGVRSSGRAVSRPWTNSTPKGSA